MLFHNRKLSPSPVVTLKASNVLQGIEAPPRGEGSPSCVLPMRFLACVLIISWSICLTNPSELNCQLSVYSELANAHFLPLPIFYHIELLKHI